MRIGLTIAGALMVMAAVGYSVIDRRDSMALSSDDNAQPTERAPALLVGSAPDQDGTSAEDERRAAPVVTASGHPRISARMARHPSSPRLRQGRVWVAPWIDGRPELERARVLGSVSRDGRVDVPAPAVGRYLLIFADRRHLTHSQVVDVRADAGIDIGTVPLRPGHVVTGTILFAGVPEGSHRFRIRYAPLGAPPSRARQLAVMWTDGTLHHGMRYDWTEWNGQFTLRGVHPGPIEVELVGEPGIETHRLPASMRLRMIDVPQTSNFHWDVPISRVRITMERDETHVWEPTVRVGPERVEVQLIQGRCEVLLAPDERMAIETTWPTGHRTIQSVDSGAIGSVTDVALSVPPPTDQSVDLRLTDMNGTALKGAWFVVSRTDVSQATYAVREWTLDADDEGWTRLRYLSPGDYTLSILARHPRDALREFVVRQEHLVRLAIGEHIRRELRVQVGGKFELRVLGAGDKRVAGRIELHGSNGKRRPVNIETKSHHGASLSTQVQEDEFGAGYSVLLWGAIPADRYTLRCSIDAGKTWKQIEFVIDVGRTTLIDIRFE